MEQLESAQSGLVGATALGGFGASHMVLPNLGQEGKRLDTALFSNTEWDRGCTVVRN